MPSSADTAAAAAAAAAGSGCGGAKRAVMRWLQLRFDFDSTAIRLLITKVIKVTVVVVTLNYLFTGSSAAARIQS